MRSSRVQLLSLMVMAFFLTAGEIDAAADVGQHTAGVAKDADSPGGTGVQSTIEVKDPDVTHCGGACLGFVRARAVLRTGTNVVLLEAGWEEAGYRSNTRYVYTRSYQDPQYEENIYSQYDLTGGTLYPFRVMECDNGNSSCAYIFYNGVWNLLYEAISWTDYLERSDVWINGVDGNQHPALSQDGRGIDVGVMKIKSGGVWTDWTNADFPNSSFFHTDPYWACDQVPYTYFRAKKHAGGCP